MKVKVVQIGNSRGIRIPKAILDQCRIAEQVELDVRDGTIVLEPVRARPRAGWAEQFRRMAEVGDDRLLIDDNLDADSGDWEW